MRFFVDLFRPVFQRLLMEELEKYFHPETPIYVLPQGKMPVRSTSKAIGYDAFIRAVVSSKEMDPVDSKYRRALFDFKTMPTDPQIARHIVEKKGKLFYRMDPLESITVGLGFVVAMDFPLFHWVAPRSGLASNEGITVTNAPGTIDSDYRGEAGMLVLNRNPYTYDIGFQMKIVQAIYQWAVIPKFVPVASWEDLSPTVRGAEGFGSTGLY